MFSHSRTMPCASLFAGICSLTICICAWIIIAFFYNANEFNPIQDALDAFFPYFGQFLFQQKHYERKIDETDENLENYVEEIRAFCQSIITATLIISVVYAFSTMLMMITTKFQLNRGLMIPYLSLTTLFIIVLIYNSFFLNLTLVFLPPYSSTSSSVSFTMFILVNIVVLASMFQFYPLENTSDVMLWIFGYMFIIYPILVVGLPNLPITFHFPHGHLFLALSLLYILFAVCLFLVLKDFTRNELEPQDKK